MGASTTLKIQFRIVDIVGDRPYDFCNLPTVSGRLLAWDCLACVIDSSSLRKILGLNVRLLALLEMFCRARNVAPIVSLELRYPCTVSVETNNPLSIDTVIN